MSGAIAIADWRLGVLIDKISVSWRICVADLGGNMAKLLRALAVGGPAAVIFAAMVLVPGAPNRAADHLDPPNRTDPGLDTTPDLPADIADVFAWHAGDTVRVAVTFGGPNPPTLAASYDRNVLYKILISTSPPNDTPDITIRARFGPGQRPGEWGIRVEGLPGVTGTIEGPVETILSKDGVNVYAGLRDEPFFFDLIGFRETRSQSAIRFSNQRNFFDGTNDTAIVLEIPKSRFAGSTMPLGFWATTSRIGGQL